MTKEKSPRTVEALQQKGKLNFTFLCRFPCKPQKMTHLLHFSIIDSQRILRRRELNYTVCTTPLWGAHREMVRGGERREWSIAGVKQTALWLRPEAWCHPETHARVLKKCREGERERGTSFRPLHRNKQDVWTQFCASQTPLDWNPLLPPCQGRPKALAQTKYMDVCVPVSLPIYVHQQTSIYQWD